MPIQHIIDAHPGTFEHGSRCTVELGLGKWGHTKEYVKWRYGGAKKDANEESKQLRAAFKGTMMLTREEREELTQQLLEQERGYE
jgi:hypothetical protein